MKKKNKLFVVFRNIDQVLFFQKGIPAFVFGPQGRRTGHRLLVVTSGTFMSAISYANYKIVTPETPEWFILFDHLERRETCFFFLSRLINRNHARTHTTTKSCSCLAFPFSFIAKAFSLICKYWRLDTTRCSDDDLSTSRAFTIWWLDALMILRKSKHLKFLKRLIYKCVIVVLSVSLSSRPFCLSTINILTDDLRWLVQSKDDNNCALLWGYQVISGFKTPHSGVLYLKHTTAARNLYVVYARACFTPLFALVFGSE